MIWAVPPKARTVPFCRSDARATGAVEFDGPDASGEQAGAWQARALDLRNKQRIFRLLKLALAQRQRVQRMRQADDPKVGAASTLLMAYERALQAYLHAAWAVRVGRRGGLGRSAPAGPPPAARHGPGGTGAAISRPPPETIR